MGALNTGVYTQETIPAFKQGDLQETQNSTDIALIDIVMPVNEENGKNGSIFFLLEMNRVLCVTREMETLLLINKDF